MLDLKDIAIGNTYITRDRQVIFKIADFKNNNALLKFEDTDRPETWFSIDAVRGQSILLKTAKPDFEF